MATFNKFNSFVEAMAEKSHNLGSDTLTVALTNSAPVAANTVLWPNSPAYRDAVSEVAWRIQRWTGIYWSIAYAVAAVVVHRLAAESYHPGRRRLGGGSDEHGVEWWRVEYHFGQIHAHWLLRGRKGSVNKNGDKHDNPWRVPPAPLRKVLRDVFGFDV